MDYQQILEDAVASARFRISTCCELRGFLSQDGIRRCRGIEDVIGRQAMQHAQESIVRNAFLIELVNQEITSTKFQTRWAAELRGDPRYADYDECVAIAEKLIDQMFSLSEEELRQVALFGKYKQVPYELPIDYRERRSAPLHSTSNIDFIFDDFAQSVIGLRAFVLSPEKNPDCSTFSKILKEKIKVKTYLTDRAQTGQFQTNREKRWETHPHSVQYALRRQCMGIEKELILQTARFENANRELVKALQESGYLEEGFETARCPITGEPLDYLQLKEEMAHTVHGRSKFQVGHMNPLKAAPGGATFGHTSSNISWISEDGNRMQGSLSMEEVDSLLIRTYINRNFEDKVKYYLMRLNGQNPNDR